MGGEISIIDCGTSITIERYYGDNHLVEVRIQGLPIVIMSEKQAINLKNALNTLLPDKVFCNDFGSSVVKD